MDPLQDTADATVDLFAGRQQEQRQQQSRKRSNRQYQQHSQDMSQQTQTVSQQQQQQQPLLNQSHEPQDSQQYTQMFLDNVIQEKYQLDPSLQLDLFPYSKQDDLFSNLPMKYQLDLAQPQYSADAPLYFPERSTDELTRRNENSYSPSSFSLPDTFESEDADSSINDNINNIRNVFSGSYTNLNNMDTLGMAKNFAVAESSSLELGDEMKVQIPQKVNAKEASLADQHVEQLTLTKKRRSSKGPPHKKRKSMGKSWKEEESDMLQENIDRYPTSVCNRCKKIFAQMDSRIYRNCMHCRKLQRGRSKRWQKKTRNKPGVCRRCGTSLGPDEAKYVQCRQCRDSLRLRKQKRAAEGKCVHCSGPNDDLSGKYRVCSKCRKREKLIREIRGQTGSCSKCGQPLGTAVQAVKTCKRCRATRHSAKIVRSVSMNVTARIDGFDGHVDPFGYPSDPSGSTESVNNNQPGASHSRRFYSEPPSDCISDFEPTMSSPTSQLKRRESLSTTRANAEMSPIFVDDLIMPHLPQDTHTDSVSR